MPLVARPKSSVVGQLLQNVATQRCLCLRPLQRVRHFTTSVQCFKSEVDVLVHRPLRQALKNEARLKKKERQREKWAGGSRPRLRDWELTVGIEVHAELNTAHKLFSRARTSINADPNAHVALFDAAIPGTQPEFQKATLIPAIRAALALNCKIQPRCSWDRKHYFYHDQPNGYQITQYYEPFARDGYLTLSLEDGIDPDDVPDGTGSLEIGIKQIQMEQDTAKSSLQAPSTHLLDFNRVSHPLIEIITLPHIHSPKTAAATVRRIRSILQSIDACVAGMEIGGLRADVNVSVRKRGSEGSNEYSGVKGPGTRTEIKNLSSLKAIEEAVRAERNRQISVLEAGGTIENETRGWTIGDTMTVRLRSKEGEVDYRYMPDPDLKPVYISTELVDHLRRTLPSLPEETLKRVVEDFGVTLKDAKTLLDGERLDYCAETLDKTLQKLASIETDIKPPKAQVGRLVVNWVLHEIGGLLTSDDRAWEDLHITTEDLAALLSNLACKQISGRVAKQILRDLYDDESTDRRSVDTRIDEDDLRSRPMNRLDVIALANEVMDENPDTVNTIMDMTKSDRARASKTMYLVGQIIKGSPAGNVDPEQAKKIVQQLIRKRSKGDQGDDEAASGED